MQKHANFTQKGNSQQVELNRGPFYHKGNNSSHDFMSLENALNTA